MRFPIKFSHIIIFTLGIAVGLGMAYVGYRWYVTKLMQRGMLHNMINYIRGRL